ncbi:MAG: hypothetical protein Q8K93_17585 [Reyranella sp.]|uniref:hypothetical protein n=1 Tax=Reyranella sp. TaxID=1929291 RepID=UPI00273125B4|nr:hypothetical protein [Reyranella sp.]MDP1964003.1 hypothetical protein [Reyranella sp.]MDP2376550.1 hypothetical protein [Reyranella sp.]
MADPRAPFYSDTGEPSPTLGSLTALLGAVAVDRLSTAFGGRRVYVPANLGAGHPLAVVAGLEAAQQLAANFAGSTLTLPITPGRRRQILDLDAAGWTRAAIASKVRLTERRVYQILADAALDAQADAAKAAQPSLF